MLKLVDPVTLVKYFLDHESDGTEAYKYIRGSKGHQQILVDLIKERNVTPRDVPILSPLGVMILTRHYFRGLVQGREDLQEYEGEDRELYMKLF
jgi:hypothetical protein